MPEKQPLYTVTDRRKFTTDGELRENRPPEPELEPELAKAAPTAATTESFATPETASSTGGPGLHLVGAEGNVDAETTVGHQQQGAYTTGPQHSAPQAGPGLEELSGDPENYASEEDDAALGREPTAAETAQGHEDYRRSSTMIDSMVRQADPGAPPAVAMDFEQLVQSIYLAAVVAMGAGGEPGQAPRIDIVGARQSIDMLSVLGEKTKGNLNDHEQRLLQGALFNVRMMFVEITNALAAQAQRPAGPGPKPGARPAAGPGPGKTR